MSDTNSKTAGLDQLTPLQRALFGLKEIRKKYDALRQERSEPIAIIGIGCRFPGGSNNLSNLSDYWKLLSNKESGVVEVPVERWDNSIYYDPDQDAPGRISTRFAALLKDVDKFDAAFFRITPREARSMDPQQRLLLEVAWEALENANIAPHTLAKSNIGVFIGIMGLDYGTNLMGSGDPEDIDAYFGTGNTLGLAAGRLSYFLKLNGPSFSLDTACSSSLVALHLASRSLRDKECNMALVGGVNIILAPEISVSFSKSHLMAPDGKSKTFDASADGYVRGEGCGVICIKRLSDAIKDGDRIWAVVRGSAVNHDGPSGGLTVPSAPAQEAVIRQALNMANLKPEDIDYIEAHGTGTSLGDPIEVGALSRVFTNPRENPLLIGSVKTNFGHLEAAAGMASLLKIVAGLQNQTIPAQLYFNTPNPKINWSSIPIKVASDHVPWNIGDRVRNAGISGFSFGGTNAHVIVSEAPKLSEISNYKENSKEEGKTTFVRQVHLLPISARSNEALKALADRYINFLDSSQQNLNDSSQPDLDTPNILNFKDICHTAATSRSHFEHRMAIVAENSEKAISLLKTAAEKGADQDLFYGKSPANPKIVFLYSGQGSQYPNMGLELYQTQPIFKQAMDRCFAFIEKSASNQSDKLKLSKQLPKSLFEIMFPLPKLQELEKNSDSSQPAQPIRPFNIFSLKPVIGTSDLDKTLYTQPAMFILEYALTELWKSWGVFPNAVMGHSLGEYGAACAAGVFTPEEALNLIIERAYLMNQITDKGKMVSVFAPIQKVQEALKPFEEKVSIAAINGPEIILISGFADAVDNVVKDLESQRIRSMQINISTAFHSPLTEQIMVNFQKIAQTISYKTPIFPVISNLTGKPIGAEICSPDYWCQHMRQPVQFVNSLLYIHKNYNTMLEIGPSPNLIDLDMTLPESLFVENGLEKKSDIRRLSSLSPRVPDTMRILRSLGELYVAGVDVDWKRFEAPFSHSKVLLPNYPFQRERHWIDRKIDKNIEQAIELNIEQHIEEKIDQNIEIKPEQKIKIGVEQNIEEKINQKLVKEPQMSNTQKSILQEPHTFNSISASSTPTNDTMEGIMIQQIQTMNQLMQRHLKILKNNCN
ncbi:MAG: acyltransferase domain-containing protein [Desulfamplus sp.]|nr:acyltransferase domain-containing protein [Desulfamplus sp.]